MIRLEHIGLAVKDSKSATRLFESLLGISAYKTEFVESESVTTTFFLVGDSKIELLTGKGDDAISKFIEKRGEGIHHLAFEVDDIHAEIKRLKELGFVLVNEEPQRGADNKLICFVHPRSANGVLIELCQEIK